MPEEHKPYKKATIRLMRLLNKSKSLLPEKTEDVKKDEELEKFIAGLAVSRGPVEKLKDRSIEAKRKKYYYLQPNIGNPIIGENTKRF